MSISLGSVNRARSTDQIYVVRVRAHAQSVRAVARTANTFEIISPGITGCIRRGEILHETEISTFRALRSEMIFIPIERDTRATRVRARAACWKNGITRAGEKIHFDPYKAHSGELCFISILYQYASRIMYIPVSCNEYWNFRECIGSPGHAIGTCFAFSPRITGTLFSFPLPFPPAKISRPIFLTIFRARNTEFYTVVIGKQSFVRQHNTVNVLFMEKRKK